MIHGTDKGLHLKRGNDKCYARDSIMKSLILNKTIFCLFKVLCYRHLHVVSNIRTQFANNLHIRC